MINKLLEFAKKCILNKYIILILFGLLWLTFFDSYTIKDRFEYDKKILLLKDEINYYQNEIKQSKRKMIELESNKEGLERFAREQYLMKKEDEDIFIFEDK